LDAKIERIEKQLQEQVEEIVKLEEAEALRKTEQNKA